MDDRLRILISAKLDEVLSTKNINSQLEKIAPKIQSLKLKIIDDSAVKELDKIAQSLQRIHDLSKQQNEIVRQHTQIVKELDGSTKKVTQQHLRNGEIIQKTTETLDKRRQKIVDEQRQVGKLASEYDKLGRQIKEVTIKDGVGNVVGGSKVFQDNNTNTRLKIDGDGRVTSETVTKNIEKERLETVKLTSAKQDLIQKTQQLAQVGVLSSQQLAGLAKTINTSANQDEIKKAQQEYTHLLNIQKELLKVESARQQAQKRSEKQQIVSELVAQKNQERLDLFRQQSALSVQSLSNRFGDSVDSVALTRYKQAVDGLSASTPRLSFEIAKLKNEFRELEAQTRNTELANKGLSQTLGTNFAKFSIWAGISTVLYGTTQRFQEMLQIMVEVDTQMTNLKRVMDADTNFDEMLDRNIEMADQLGQKLTEVNKAAQLFAQAGESLGKADGSSMAERVADLTKTAIIASNVSDLTIEDSASNITSALVQFNMTAKESIQVVDKLNEVDNNFAITTKDLAQGIYKAGSTANTFGVTLDELVGHITAIGMATRESGNVVGNGLKTIYSRLTTMDDAIDVLENVANVKVFEDDGTVRTATQILGDLATKWNDLSEIQRQNIGVTVAGRYQLSRFFALMSNYQLATDATATSLHSQGSAIQENERYLESMQAQINMLTAAWQEFAVRMGEAGVGAIFMSLVKFLTLLLNGLSDLSSDGFGSVIVTAGALTTAGWGLIAMFNAWRTAILGTAAAAVTLQRSLGWIGLIASGISLVASLFAGASDENEKHAEALFESGQASKENADRIEELVQKYNELKPQAETSVEAQKELKLVMSELTRIAPALADEIEKSGDAYDKNTESAKKHADALRMLSNDQIRAAEVAAKIEFENAAQSAEKARIEMEEAREEFGSALDDMSRLQQEYDANNTVDIIANIKKELAEVSKQIQSGSKVSGLSKTLQTLERDLAKAKHIADEYGDVGKKYADAVNAFNTAEADKQSSSNKLNVIQNYLNGIEVSAERAADSVKSFDGEVVDLGESTEEVESSIGKLVDSTGSLEKIQKGLANNIGKQIDKMSDLNKALDKLASGHKLTYDEINKLISQYPELQNQIQIENGQLVLTKQALEQTRQARLDEFNVAMNAAKEKVRVQEEAVRKELELIGIEIGALETLAQAQIAAAQAADKLTQGKGATNMRASMVASDIEGKFYDKLSGIVNAKQSLEKLKSLSSTGFNFSTSSDNTTKKSSKDPVDPYVSDEYSKALSRLDTQQKVIETNMSRLSEKSSQYRQNLSALADIERERQKLASAEASRLRSENTRLNGQLSSTKDQEKRNDLLKQIDDNIEKISKLQGAWQDSAQTIIDLQSRWQKSNFDSITSATTKNINALEDSLADLDILIKKNDHSLSNLEENTSEYNNALKKQSDLYVQKQGLLHQQANALRQENQSLKELLKNQAIDVKLKEEIEAKIRSNENAIRSYGSAWADLEQNIIQNQIKIAKEIIDVAKDAIEKQKELELDAIDERIRAEEKRHRERMENIEEEERRFEEQINAQLRAIDRQADQEDYEKELSNAQKERDRILADISKYALDDSVEAEAKLAELREQLAEKTERIEEIKNKRNRDLRKQNLQDQLDSYKKDTEAKKKAEDKNSETIKDSLEEEKRLRERHYEDILNDDRRWAQIRKDIVAGNLTEIQSLLAQYVGYYESIINDSTTKMGKSIKQNVLDSLKNAQDLLGLPSGGSSNPSTKDSTFERYLMNGLRWNYADDTDKLKLHTENEKLRREHGYQSYSVDDIKRLFPDVYEKFKQESLTNYIKNKFQWNRTSDSSERNRLNELNSKYRSQFGFEDYNLEQIIRLFPDLAKQYGFGGSSGISSVLSSVSGFASQIVGGASELVSNMMSAIKTPSLAPVTVSGGGSSDTNYHLTIKIDNMYGTKKEVDSLAKTLMGGLNRIYGVKT